MIGAYCCDRLCWLVAVTEPNSLVCGPKRVEDFPFSFGSSRRFADNAALAVIERPLGSGLEESDCRTTNAKPE